MFGKPQKTLTVLTLAAFLATSITPAVAADFGGMPDMRYNPYVGHAQTRGTTAGVYLRLPFKGGLKRPREEARVGFAFSTKLSGRSGKPGHFGAPGTPKLFDLSLGLSGRQPLGQSLRFNGVSLHQINTLHADDDGKKKGTIGKVVNTGLMVLGGVILVGGAVLLLKSEPEYEPTWCGWFVRCE